MSKLKQINVVVDVESNGPAPGLFSMTSFGAVVVEEGLNRTFEAGLLPLPGASSDAEAAKIDQFAGPREDPAIVMTRFVTWLGELSKNRIVFWSDNPCYDWQFMNYYLICFAGKNPFGYSGRRIGDVYCGVVGNLSAPWKHLRKTTHTHSPVYDAKGNAEALLEIMDMLRRK